MIVAIELLTEAGTLHLLALLSRDLLLGCSRVAYSSKIVIDCTIHVPLVVDGGKGCWTILSNCRSWLSASVLEIVMRERPLRSACLRHFRGPLIELVRLTSFHRGLLKLLHLLLSSLNVRLVGCNLLVHMTEMLVHWTATGVRPSLRGLSVTAEEQSTNRLICYRNAIPNGHSASVCYFTLAT